MADTALIAVDDESGAVSFNISGFTEAHQCAFGYSINDADDEGGFAETSIFATHMAMQSGFATWAIVFSSIDCPLGVAHGRCRTAALGEALNAGLRVAAGDHYQYLKPKQ